MIYLQEYFINNCCRKVSLALPFNLLHRSFAVIAFGILSLHLKWIRVSKRGTKP